MCSTLGDYPGFLDSFEQFYPLILSYSRSVPSRTGLPCALRTTMLHKRAESDKCEDILLRHPEHGGESSPYRIIVPFHHFLHQMCTVWHCWALFSPSRTPSQGRLIPPFLTKTDRKSNNGRMDLSLTNEDGISQPRLRPLWEAHILDKTVQKGSRNRGEEGAETGGKGSRTLR